MNPLRSLPWAGLAVAGLVTLCPAAGGAEPANHGLDLTGRDTTVSPCEDFFQYANGGWIERAEIPPSHAGTGSFVELRDRSRETLHQLLEAAVRRVTAPPGSDVGKLAIFYGTCMDSMRAEEEDAKPIEPELARIAALGKPSDLAAEIAWLHLKGVMALFRFGVRPDAKNSSQMIASASQGGLGLPDRDYYTREDSSSRAIRSAYVAHVARMLELLGDPAAPARAGAERVLSIETALAQASMTNVERRNPKATYHKMTVGELQGLSPAFRWSDYLERSGLQNLADLNVSQPDFFAAVNRMIEEVPLADWKTYLRWHVARAAAPYLSSRFVDEDFDFNRLLTGAREPLPRWKRCVAATDRALGEALGQEYVKRFFPPEAKQRALEMVHNLEAAMKARIERLTWMSDSTRAQALVKLAAIRNKIGYPEKWRDYSALDLERGPFVLNWMRAQEFENRYDLAKVGKPVDRGEWRMTPPTVNAYYSSSNNDINFPAGILQPPFFNPKADDAVNYGGIGAVIGHEMTHGFDDRGRQFDAEGNLRDWWTAQDADRYRERADRVIEQYDGYVAVDTVHVNGRLTISENISDLGGLSIAYEALERSMEAKPRPPLIDGLTPEQRFFLSWAQVWRSKFRPEAIRTRIATDSHSPAKWRVNGPTSNMPEFARAFGCRPDAPMVRSEALRTEIW